MPELVWADFVVWIGAGPMAGIAAIGVHTVGILGRLFGEVYEDIDGTARFRKGDGRMGTGLMACCPKLCRSFSHFSFSF